MTYVKLGPPYRADALRRMSENDFDVLVVGGGVVGAGVALDAVSRGLTVALVEARDWAAGTSSRSSKLIHGGLRYLEQLDFGLVREALKERALLLTRLAPHLVWPVPFLFPLRHRLWERFYVGAGVTLYDLLGGDRTLPRHRQMSRRQALSVAPGLRPDALVGAIQLVRRTRIAIEERDRGLVAAPEVAALIAPVLGWDEDDVHRELRRYRLQVRAEQAAERQADDVSADVVRAKAWGMCDVTAKAG
jgi:glycerol-3-phosphate dehydrogenase